MNNIMSSNVSSSRVLVGAALAGVTLMGLIAWGISEYDGYVDELLVYQSLVLGLVGGLLLSGGYLLFFKSKETFKFNISHPKEIITQKYSQTPLEHIPHIPTSNTPHNLMRKTFSYIAYFSVFTLVGLSLGFLGCSIFIIFNLSELFEDASNQYSIFMIIFFPFQLICMLLVSMSIGGVIGAIAGVVLKKFSI